MFFSREGYSVILLYMGIRHMHVFSTSAVYNIIIAAVDSLDAYAYN